MTRSLVGCRPGESPRRPRDINTGYEQLQSRVGHAQPNRARSEPAGAKLRAAREASGGVRSPKSLSSTWTPRDRSAAGAYQQVVGRESRAEPGASAPAPIEP